MDDQAKEDLKSLASAGARTRAVVLALVIACVIGFTAFLNSCRWGWVAQRASKVAHENNYPARKLGFTQDIYSPLERRPSSPSRLLGFAGFLFNSPKKDAAERKKHVTEEFSDTLIKEYVENGFQIKIPFFGVIIDLYDIGLVGGLAYSTILLLLFYSLNTESTALRLAFSEAARTGPKTLRSFYAVLATRQVLSIPKTRAVSDQDTTPLNKGPADEHPSFFWLRLMPKTLILFPIVVYIIIISYDFTTFNMDGILAKFIQFF